jgi:hypothetical protein
LRYDGSDDTPHGDPYENAQEYTDGVEFKNKIEFIW